MAAATKSAISSQINSITMVLSKAMRQFFAFLTVGGVTFLVYFASFRVAKLAGPDWLALSIAYAIALGVHFSLNRLITFRAAAGGRNRRILVRYGALVIMNYGLSTAVSLAALKAGFPDAAALIMGTAATTGFGFLVSRHWVFV